jgi:hypothetical protein
MKTKFTSVKSNRNNQSHARRAMATAALTLLFGGTASAQVSVINYTGDLANKAGFAAQLAKTVEQLQQEVAQYEQLLNTVEGLGTNISLVPNQLQPIGDPTALVDQSCPGASGGALVSSVVTSIASSLTGTASITDQQQELCQKITLLQIDEYNKTVDIANKIGGYGGTLQKLNTLANEVNTLGTSSGATTQAQTYAANITTEMNDWQTQLAGDENLIKALQAQQGILARTAMRGQNTPLGNVIQAGALAAWFAANHYSQNNVIQNNAVQN